MNGEGFRYLLSSAINSRIKKRYLEVSRRHNERMLESTSLRRHDPDQVIKVVQLHLSAFRLPLSEYVDRIA